MRYLFPLLMLPLLALPGCEPVNAGPPITAAVATVAVGQATPETPAPDTFKPETIKFSGPTEVLPGQTFPLRVDYPVSDRLKFEPKLDLPPGAGAAIEMNAGPGFKVWLVGPAGSSGYKLAFPWQWAKPIGEWDDIGTVTYEVKVKGQSPPVVVNPDKPDTPVNPDTKPTAATFVYEKDLHAVPAPVLSALNKLNREKGIVATALEADTKDGTGDVPTQYKTVLAEAKNLGLPCLVVTAGDKVLKVVSNPKTEADVLGAIQ